MIKYKGYTIEIESGVLTNRKFYSILTPKQVVMAERGQFFIPIRETSMKDAKAMIDKLTQEQPNDNQT